MKAEKSEEQMAFASIRRRRENVEDGMRAAVNNTSSSPNETALCASGLGYKYSCMNSTEIRTHVLR